MFVGDRTGEIWPVGVPIDPGPDKIRQLGLQHIEMAGFADLQIARAGDGGIGRDQIEGIQQSAAVVALVAPRLLEAAVRANPLHIAVGEEATVVDGVDHAVQPLFDQAVLFQHMSEMLGQFAVLRAGGTAEPVERQAERLADIALQGVLLVAVGGHILPGRRRGQLGWRAMFVGGADIEHLMPTRPLKPRIDIGRQHRPRQVPKVLDPIDIGQSGSDQDTAHGA
jgi:hypothetical protein